MRCIFMLACATLFGIAGFWLGYSIHGASAAALVPTLAGAAGGFGIAYASLDVLRRWRPATATLDPHWQRGKTHAP